jgi:putative thioredoxin
MPQAIDVNRTTFDEVVLRGSATHPVLVDFWAPWCGPCRTLAPILDRVTAEFAGRVTLAKLDTDTEPELASAYGVRGIPNCKLFVDGRVVDEFTGVIPESAIRAFLDRHVPSPAAAHVGTARSRLIEDDANGALEAIEQALAADPDHEDALLTRMEALLAAGRAAEAGEFAAVVEAPQRLRTRPLRDASRFAALKARASLAASGSQDLDALTRQAAETNAGPQAKLDYAAALAARGEYERALDALLRVVQSDRAFGDDAARRAMLTVFEALGPDNDLARRYRRELAAAINR